MFHRTPVNSYMLLVVRLLYGDSNNDNDNKYFIYLGGVAPAGTRAVTPGAEVAPAKVAVLTPETELSPAETTVVTPGAEMAPA